MNAGGDGAAPPRGRDRLHAAALVVGATLLGVAWAVGLPLMAAPDEPSHMVRAAAVARGELRGVDELVVEPQDDGRVFRGLYTDVLAPADYGQLHTILLCWLGHPTRSADCMPPIEDADRVVRVRTNFGTYPPLFYAVTGWPTLLADLPSSVHLARAAGATASGALLAAGFLALARLRLGAAPVVGGLVAAVPQLWFLVGSVNPNGFESAAAFAMWAFGLLLLLEEAPPSRFAVWGLAVSSSALALTRPLSPLFVVVIAVVLTGTFATGARLRALAGSTRVRAAAAVTAAAGLLAGAWILTSGTLDAFLGFRDPDLTFAEAFRESLAHPPDWADQMVANFGWLEFQPGPALTAPLQAAILAMAVAALVTGGWRRRAGVAALLAIVVLGPVLLEARQAPEVGFIWQGRYTLPLAVGVPIVAGAVLGARRPRARPWRIAGVVGGAALVLVAVGGQAVGFATAMRRYATGVDAPLLGWLRDAAWTPPAPAALLLATVAVGAVTVAAAALAAARRHELRPVPAAAPPSREDDAAPSPRSSSTRREPQPDRPGSPRGSP